MVKSNKIISLKKYIHEAADPIFGLEKPWCIEDRNDNTSLNEEEYQNGGSE